MDDSTNTFDILEVFNHPQLNSQSTSWNWESTIGIGCFTPALDLRELGWMNASVINMEMDLICNGDDGVLDLGWE